LDVIGLVIIGVPLYLTRGVSASTPLASP
jgi:hypothetical protein